MKSALLWLVGCAASAALGYFGGLQSSAAPSPAPIPAPLPQPQPPPELRMAVVNARSLFEAHPRTKPREDAINVLRGEARTELQRLKDSGDSAAANAFRDRRETELRAEANRSRQQIVDEIRVIALRVAARKGIHFVFDASGDSLNGIPIVMHGDGVPDLTTDVVAELSK